MLSEQLDLDSLQPDKVTERETDDPDMKHISSTEKGNLSLNFTPGMTIKGNANNYILEKILGSGAFGLVARCRIEGTMKYVALKIMAESDKREFLNEVQILESLNKSSRYNTCFIRLNDSFVYRNFLCQELELLDENLALKHLGVTHTDIKPDNVMLVNHKAQPFRVKLIDFGLARKTGCLPQEGNLEVLAFRAPEITLGLPRDEAIDTWSLGCLLSFMFLNCIVFPRENKYDNLRMIVKLLGQPDQKLLDKGTLRADPAYDDLTSLDDLFFSQNTSNSTENEDIHVFLDLVKRLLAVDPDKRILPADALKHPFITMEHLKNASDKSYLHGVIASKQEGCRLKSYLWLFIYIFSGFSPCMRGFSLGAPVPPTPKTYQVVY
uniref:Protein kinase domain-containing protein n=1 Tax=Nothobranchius furzeri TaxID=105023 RepID=A0A8C6LU83_NOTFU